MQGDQDLDNPDCPCTEGTFTVNPPHHQLSGPRIEVKRSEIASTLRNTQKHQHAVVGSQKSFDERKVAAFRKFCTDFFDEGDVPKDPLELARHGADKLRGKLDELKARVAGSKYPFVDQLEQPIQLLEQVVDRHPEWYLTEFNLGNELLDAKESVIDPIQSFLSGVQQGIYDDAASLLADHSSNLGYLPVGSADVVRSALDDPSAFRGKRMAQLKQATADLRAEIDQVVEESRKQVATAIEERKAELVANDYYTSATSEAQTSVVQKVEQETARIGAEPQIAVIREIGATFEAKTYPALLDQLAASQQDDDDDAPPPKQTVSVRTVQITGAGGVLETEEDVDRYIAALRAALMATLNDGKRISL